MSMSTQTPEPKHRAPLWRRGWVRGLGIAVLAFLVGVAASPAPEAEVETVTRTERVTEEVPVEVPVTPAECGQALDMAEQALAVGAESLGLAGAVLSEDVPAILDAAAVYDVATVEAVTADVETKGDRMAELVDDMPDPATYNDLAATCRAAQ